MVDQRRHRHGDRVWYQTDDDHTRSLPRVWTSLALPDPFAVISAGRAYFRPEDLLRLATLLDETRGSELDPESES